MAADVRDLGDTIGSALGRIAREATQSVSSDGSRGLLRTSRGSDGALSGMKGVAAGAALAAAAPFAAKRAGRAAKGAEQALKQAASSTVSEKLEQVGGAPGAVKEAAKQAIPGMGGDKQSKGGSQQGQPGVGKGRRMPVQQAADIAVPLSTAYNQWTQFEQWPEFMHRLMQVTQEDDCTVSFKVKLWGMSKEFTAEIDEQRPDERIKWHVGEGVIHSGVVTFHELAPRLTRVQVSLDVEPGSLIEKAARGMRHVKRAVRADLARFKAFIEMEEQETGAWRGVIRDGKVAKQAGQAASASERSGSRGRARQRGGGGDGGARAGSRRSGSRSGSNAATRRSSGSRSGSNARRGSR
jgi:uncharacterized membrane protein